MLDLAEMIPVDALTTWYHDLHKKPELANSEKDTADYIEAILRTLPNISVYRPHETSVVALLEGQYEGDTIAFRAAMDATELEEETGLDFASQHPNIMHANGHDAQIAVLLGLAEVLSQQTERLSGKVKLIFQQASEDHGSGACDLVSAAVVADVDRIYGFHFCPQIPTGAVGYHYGQTSSSSDQFFLNIKGEKGQVTAPNKTVDLITYASQLIQRINQLATRFNHGQQGLSCAWQGIEAFAPTGLLPDELDLTATVRANNSQLGQDFHKQLEQLAQQDADLFDLNIELDYQAGADSMTNDQETLEALLEVARDIIGEQGLFTLPDLQLADDFATYSQEVAAAWVVIGAGSIEDGYHYPNYHPGFKLDEMALPVATLIFSQLALDLLTSESPV